MDEAEVPAEPTWRVTGTSWSWCSAQRGSQWEEPQEMSLGGPEGALYGLPLQAREALHLGDAELDVVPGEGEGGDEAVGVGGAEVDDPVVVDGAVGVGEGGVLEPGEGEADCGVEDADVDALVGHHLDALVGVPGARDTGEGLLPGEVALFEDVLLAPSLGGADGGDVGAAALGVGAGHHAVEAPVFEALVIDIDAEGAGAVVGGYVVGPEGSGFEDVSVYVDERG